MRPRSLSFAVVMTAVLLVAGPAGAQPWFYEQTPYIGVSPGLNDWAVCSAYEQPPSAFQGIFADWNARTQLAGNPNTGGAMDANPAVWAWRFATGQPGDIYPTGSLCVTKNIAGTIPIIETYQNVNSTHIPWEINNQDLAPQASWITAAASGQSNWIMASDIANGFIGFGDTPFITDYLITAETFGGALHLVAYALTNPWGQPVQPYLVNGTNTGLTGWCLGLTTCNGLNLGTGVPSDNVIVFVENMVVHAITFDVRTATFGTLDQTGVYTTPWNLASYGSTIKGLWIAQNRQFPGAVHDVGISIPNPQPTPAPGTFAILRQTGLGTLVYTGVGGGPVCHVPYGSPGFGPAQWVFPANNQAGWYVVTPGAGAARWTIAAFNTSSASPSPWFGYWYPIGAQDNGTPLSHPTAIGVMQNNNLRKGLLWVPWKITSSSTYMIDLIEGFGSGVLSSFPHTVPQQNHPGQGTLPKAGRTWAGTDIVPDQKTNYKCEYGLGQHAGLLDY